ncbi:MAG TPA: hypothetical protein VGM87_21335 [Roseomonas sp.]
MALPRLLPLLLLAACQAGGEGPFVAPQPVSATGPAAAPPAPVAPARAAVVVPVPPANTRPGNTAALLGTDAGAVIGLFGPPLLRRSEGSAEIWLYAGPDCHLDIVFYPGEGGGAARVAHAATRSEGATPRTEAECLAGIARRPA